MNVNYPFTRASNRYFDLMGEMSFTETKIVGIIMRRTVGWDKVYESISYPEFIKATGIKSRSTIRDAIKSSTDKGYIQIDSKKGRGGATRYALGCTLTSTVDEPIDNQIGTVDEPIQNNTETSIGTVDELVNSEIGTPPELVDAKIGTVDELHIKKKKIKEKEIKEKILSVTSTDTLNSVDEQKPTPEVKQEQKKMITEPPTLDDFFSDDEPQPEYDNPDLVTDFTNTPFTQTEYEYFVVGKRCSLGMLTTNVYDPNSYHIEIKDKPPLILNPCWDDRQSYLFATKKLSDWHRLVGVVEHFFPTKGKGMGYATKIAQQIAGKSKKGERKYFNIEPPMDSVEAHAFAYWMQVQERLTQLPERAERIQERALQFRALPNHFEHLNFAQYKINQLFRLPQDKPELEPLVIVPEEETRQLYADLEAQYGFKISGSYG